jgi:hypothetical protein
VTYKPKPTSLAHIVSKTAAVGSRLERFVGRLRRIEITTDCTTNPAIYSTYANQQDTNGKPTPTNGGMVPGLGAKSASPLLNFASATNLNLRKARCLFFAEIFKPHSGT